MLGDFGDDGVDDPEWRPCIDVEGGSSGCNLDGGNGYSTGDSNPDPGDTSARLLGQLGVYAFGPRTEEEEKFIDRYADANWHARTWNLLPRHDFSGPTPGPRIDYAGKMPTPLECFLTLWDNKIQQGVVRESNIYSKLVNPKTGRRKGEPGEKLITLKDHRQFTGICAFMAIREQPSMRDC